MVIVEVSEVSKSWENMNFGWKLCEKNCRFNLKGRTCVVCNDKYLKIFTFSLSLQKTSFKDHSPFLQGKGLYVCMQSLDFKFLTAFFLLI